MPPGQEPCDQPLGGQVRARVHRLLGVDQQRLQLGGGVDPSHAETRRDGLGERPHREHQRVTPAELAQARQVVTLEAQQRVGVVVDEDRPPLTGELEQPQPPSQRERRAGRVLEGRDGVDRRGRPACAAHEVGQGVDHHPVGVDRDLQELGAVGQRGRAAVGVRRRLDHDQVARVDEELARQVEALHPARGDGQPVRAGLVAWSRAACPAAPRAAAGRPRWRRSRTRRAGRAPSQPISASTCVGIASAAGLPMAKRTTSWVCRCSSEVLESITEPTRPLARSASRSRRGSITGHVLSRAGSPIMPDFADCRQSYRVGVF